MHIPKILVRPMAAFIRDREKRHTFIRYHLKNDLHKIMSKGKNNKIIIVKEGIEKPLNKKYIFGPSIQIFGNNNIIKIYENSIYENVNIVLANSSHNMITIGINCHLRNSCFTINGQNQKLVIGNHVEMAGVNIRLSQNSNCVIGDNCLFSSNIVIWGGDGHKIKDKTSNKVINENNTTLKIGPHCWIGENCRITKNSILPPNTIVGCASVITKPFSEENTIIAGNPAKIVKKNVDWEF